MDVAALDQALYQLIQKRDTLARLGYDHEQYDEVEEELHNLEDDLQVEFGDYLENALKRVHDEYCPESEVLLPMAYLPRQYQRLSDATGIDEYEIGDNDGVWVELKDFPSLDAKLVLLPSPPRLELLSQGGSQEVWRAI
jgi:hypothetical protein